MASTWGRVCYAPLPQVEAVVLAGPFVLLGALPPAPPR